MKSKILCKGELLLALMYTVLLPAEQIGACQISHNKQYKYAAQGDGVFVDHQITDLDAYFKPYIKNTKNSTITKSVKDEFHELFLKYPNGDQVIFYYWPKNSKEDQMEITVIEAQGRVIAFDAHKKDPHNKEKFIYQREYDFMLKKWYLQALKIYALQKLNSEH